MYSPRAHPGPPSPMDSEILIKPLSLWPEYSTGGLLILLKNGGLDAPTYAPQNSVLRAMHPGCTPIILAFLGPVLSDFATWKNPGTVVAPGFCRKINAWRTEVRGGRPSGRTSCTLSRKMAYFQAFYGTVLKMHPDMHPKNRYFGLFANAWLTFEIRSFGWL